MSRISSFLAGAALTAAIVLPFTSAALQQDPKDMPPPEEMVEMMKKTEKITSPGSHHQALEKLIGDWHSTLHLVFGGTKTPGEAGQAEISWLLEGRWLQIRTRGKIVRWTVSSRGWGGCASSCRPAPR